MAITHRKGHKNPEDGDVDVEKKRQDEEKAKRRSMRSRG